ncbi:hypothetical protein EJ110_NYTH08154 [Nymphaea thermarum]|nr:hypothetical protein EJ110_NYTH08154 [Nymphaea thermarum]
MVLQGWAGVVAGNQEADLENCPTVTIDRTGDEPTVVFPVEAYQKMKEQYRFAAVAGFYEGKCNTGIDYRYVFQALRQLWIDINCPKFSVIGNGRFLVRVSSEEELREVLCRKWVVGGRFLITSRWKPGTELRLNEEESIPLWIQLPQLPVLFWNSYSFKAIAQGMGASFIRTDECTMHRDKLSFARVCIDVLLKFNPVPKITIEVRRKKISQEVLYESRVQYYSVCGTTSHYEISEPRGRETQGNRFASLGSQLRNEEKNKDQPALSLNNMATSSLGDGSSQQKNVGRGGDNERNKFNTKVMKGGKDSAQGAQEKGKAMNDEKGISNPFLSHKQIAVNRLGERTSPVRFMFAARTEELSPDKETHHNINMKEGFEQGLTFESKQVEAADIKQRGTRKSTRFVSKGKKGRPPATVSSLEDVIVHRYNGTKKRKKEMDNMNHALIELPYKENEGENTKDTFDDSRGQKPFRIFKPWLLDRKGKEVIHEAWRGEVQGCPMMRLLFKFNRLRMALVDWNKHSFGNLSDNIAILQSRLEGCREQMEQGIEGVIDEEHMANRGTINTIKIVLEDFERLAGMKVNKQKSEIFAKTMVDCQTSEIQGILQWTNGNLPSEYLGLPLFLGSLTENLCLPLLTKVEKRLAAWKARLLSYTGRLCLIRATNQSWGWKGLRWGWSWIQDKVEWKLGNGECVRFWTNPWSRQVLLTRADGRGYGLQGKELITSVQEFTSASQGSPSLDIAARLGVFKDDIRLRDGNDSLVWSDDGKDNFIAADIMSKCRTQGVKEWWRKKIWYSSAPAKSCWHTYIACEGRLPTLDRLQKAGIHLANRCSLCLCAEEDNGHILIKCKMAKEVWRYVAAKFGRVKFPQGEIVAEFKRWLQVRILGKWRRRCWRMTFLIVCWSLWRLRNTCFHDSIQPHISRFKKEVWRNCIDSFFAVKWSPETDLKLRIWLQTGLYSVDANVSDRSAVLINIARAHTKLGQKIAGLSYADNGLMGCVVIIKDKGRIHEGELEVLERIIRFHKDYGGD